MSAHNSPATARQPPRKRLKGACKACHNRKVRCTLAKSGPPCVNCSLDEIECELRTRKPRKTSRGTTPSRDVPSRSLDSPDDPGEEEVSITVATPQLEAQPEPHRDSSGSSSSCNQDNVPRDLVGVQASVSEASKETPDDTVSNHYRPFRSHFSHFKEDDATNPELLPADTPMYADLKGNCAIVNICEPDRGDESGHFLLPNGVVPSLVPEDLEYLQRKGAFALPEARIRDDLVRTYFRYVHPSLPIVDAQEFLTKYESASLDKIGLHLLWSMYLAASNFADEDVVQRAGYSNRKEMKRSIFRIAKALYDMQYESDGTKLIQAVLLMSFCSSDTQDKTGPRHWVGIALSLCQTAGFHRNPRLASSHIPVQRQRLWRLIWWSCVHQDVWFSAGMGRPMRINLDDCDTRMPATEDADAMVIGVPETLREKYLPSDLHSLSPLFVESIKLAIVQANILSTHYCLHQAAPSRGDVVSLEQRLSAIHDKLSCFRSSENRCLYYHACHLELFLQSVRIMLYRPYLRSLLNKPPADMPQDWCLSMERKAQAAAAGFNQTLEVLITADVISKCQGCVCIALLAPMQIHLLNSTSRKPLIAAMGRNSLDMCMLVSDELRKTYFGAELIYRLFSQAMSHLTHRKKQRDSTGNSQSADSSNLQIPAAQNSVNATSDHDSSFAGLEGILNGTDFYLMEADFDFAFTEGSGDDALLGQWDTSYARLPVENLFGVDKLGSQ
ncbi:Zn(2)-C6 fungal-type domain-containing protein [Fusarium keratoplasticum]|nr:Zn(2)-C6 fungal-type domain-containing protein [Fusarium keratoplasticum]